MMIETLKTVSLTYNERMVAKDTAEVLTSLIGKELMSLETGEIIEVDTLLTTIDTLKVLASTGYFAITTER